MKNNLIKKLFEMNKIFIISFFIVASFFFLENANAISGACSSHNGVNCSMGRQLNGKVYCNDGWTESMADYDFMVMCQNYQFSCNTSEWNNLSSKYGLEELFFKMQDIVNRMDDIAHDAADLSKSYDINLFYSLQTQHNFLKSQYNQASTLAERECFAIGADRASQQNYEKMQSDFYNDQIKAEQDKLAQLEQEKQKLTENYLNALNNLNTPQYTCPANSTLNGTICPCNDGYVSNGSVCITYTQSCQTKYGVNSYGDKQYCHCSAGYEWNTSQTACINVEVKPIIPPPTVKSVVQETSNHRDAQKIAKPAEKLIVKSELSEEDTLTTSTYEKISAPKEEIKKESKSGFFVRVFGSVKNFFLSIFK